MAQEAVEVAVRQVVIMSALQEPQTQVEAAVVEVQLGLLLQAPQAVQASSS